MHAQHVLDLAGRDILAATHIFDVPASAEKQKSRLVQPAAIVGGKPTVGPYGLLVKVLARDLLAAHPDLAFLTRCDGLAGRIANLELDSRQRTVDRTATRDGARVAAGNRYAMIPRRQHGDGRAG